MNTIWYKNTKTGLQFEIAAGSTQHEYVLKNKDSFQEMPNPSDTAAVSEADLVAKIRAEVEAEVRAEMVQKELKAQREKEAEQKAIEAVVNHAEVKDVKDVAEKVPEGDDAIKQIQEKIKASRQK